ncbi:MAG: hypothetical protein ACFFCS_00305 [Candidatus Hodarchaeota archaeon]
MMNESDFTIDEFEAREMLFGKKVKRLGVLIGQEHFKKRWKNKHENINGPRLIKVPGWIEDALGKYYLYFGNHNGKYIRLAYSEEVEGPYRLYKPGVLPIKKAPPSVINHIASPEPYIDDGRKEIRLYFHGKSTRAHEYGKNSKQLSFVAISSNGLDFKALNEPLTKSYLNVFTHDGYFYGLAKSGEHSGQFYRSPDGIKPFDMGQKCFPDARHFGTYFDGKILHVLFSRASDCPERILYNKVEIQGKDWMEWQEDPKEEFTVLAPKEEWEGTDLPFTPPRWGAAKERVRQLRDPAWFIENEKIYILYSIAGESGIALVSLQG